MLDEAFMECFRFVAFKVTLGREGAVDSTYFELHGSLSAPTAATDTQPTTFTKLPRAFMLQMDNSAKDNKNIHVLAFCSELVKRGIFETVEVNFLMVGHTHEDIDAFFSKVSARTINKDVLTLPTLMAEIWESEAMHPVPLLLEEVADYKSYVDGFLDKLEGHSQPIGFRFSMANNVPIYKFQSKDELALDELERELQAENEMQLQPYVGPPSLRPKRVFVPLEDICEGKFVVLRPENDFEAEVPKVVWLGRAMGAVVRDNNDEHHGQFLIEWWRPRHRKSTNATNKERMRPEGRLMAMRPEQPAHGSWGVLMRLLIGTRPHEAPHRPYPISSGQAHDESSPRVVQRIMAYNESCLTICTENHLLAVPVGLLIICPYIVPTERL
ncbi:hypothetical protein R1sor_008695 [Riccia sorocarpa]|uniref:DUF7869 domain-containing protein n=1 Tax=Riccia sorocarpa TaxID=122646 RepID=A0ABD3I0D6_9MARC